MAHDVLFSFKKEHEKEFTCKVNKVKLSKQFLHEIERSNYTKFKEILYVRKITYHVADFQYSTKSCLSCLHFYT